MRIEGIADQVSRNCRVADAEAWGHYSLCGLLLRLRELYKWEQGLAPWTPVETVAILNWVGVREAEWERLEGKELEPIRVGDESFDPFDEDGISARLLPEGWLYAAGSGPRGRSLFVLGEVRELRYEGGVPIYILGRELVRDLSPTPALSRRGRIIARGDVMPWFLWSALEDAGTKADPGPAVHALRDAGLDPGAVFADPEAYAAALGALAERELETAIRHEIGELAEGDRPGRNWEALIRRAAGTKGEILARALKDALADAGDSGTLRFLIRNRRRGALALFAGSDRGLRHRVLPEARQIWAFVLHGGDWDAAERLRQVAYRRLEGFLDPLFGIFEDDPARDAAARRSDELEEQIMG